MFQNTHELPNRWKKFYEPPFLKKRSKNNLKKEKSKKDKDMRSKVLYSETVR